MNHRVVQAAGQTYLELTPDARPLEQPQDALELVSLSWETGCRLFLLPRELLTDAFFDLRSGLAGEVLQKLSNYDLRLAALVPDLHAQPPRFQELALEAGRGRTFAVFAARAEAEAWLLG